MMSEGRMSISTLKNRLRNGDTVLGTILPLPSPEIAEIIGLAGYDCVLLDSEHGPLTHETLQDMARACRAAGTAPIVRVPDHHPKQILRALDSGCVGVMVPQVETAEQAAAIVAATRYAPGGVRSLAGATPAARWGVVPLADHVTASNACVVNLLQVETRRGLEAVEDIARVPGVDVLFIGPSDLSQSLGHPGEMGHPDVQAAFRRIIETGRAAEVAIGILALTADDVRAYRSLGVTIFLDSAPRLFLRACQAQVAGMRDAAARAGAGPRNAR
jgi:4-hydroxy-2-oxoheptanedioate aldolase